jgi:cytochrome d ubiquinol oxidase subunit II
MVTAFFVLLQKALAEKAHVTPFVYALALVFLGYLGLGISIWPNIIPPDISIYAAASPPESQRFALVGALIIIPLIIAYTAWGYYVFRGKVSADDHYH